MPNVTVWLMTPPTGTVVPVLKKMVLLALSCTFLVANVVPGAFERTSSVPPLSTMELAAIFAPSSAPVSTRKKPPLICTAFAKVFPVLVSVRVPPPNFSNTFAVVPPVTGPVNTKFVGCTPLPVPVPNCCVLPVPSVTGPLNVSVPKFETMRVAFTLEVETVPLIVLFPEFASAPCEMRKPCGAPCVVGDKATPNPLSEKLRASVMPGTPPKPFALPRNSVPPPIVLSPPTRIGAVPPPNAPALVPKNTPCVTTSEPKVSPAFVSRSVPVPLLIKVAPLEITPLKVVLELSPPNARIAPPALTAPLPASEPMR